jgi:hypothetical protein
MIGRDGFRPGRWRSREIVPVLPTQREEGALLTDRDEEAGYQRAGSIVNG